MLSASRKHGLKTISLKQYHFPNYEGIHYERKIKVIIKVGVGFLYILGMTLTIKIKTICVFTMATEKFLQLNYSQKA